MEDQLNSKIDPIFEIYYKEKKQSIPINSSDMNFTFTEALIDVTFIQLTDELINKINPHFLIPYNKECIKNDLIMVIQYPVNHSIQKLSIAPGNIKYSSNINYCHTSSTFSASSGSPLINNSCEVVGIHKSSNGNENYATKLTIAKYVICTAYKRKCNNEISNTIGIINKLSQEHHKALIKHDLIEQKNNLFKYTGNESIPSLLFYRTNHAWYWTNQIIENNNIKTLRHLNWKIIIPHEKINKEEESLIPIHKVLIMWLRLSEFMYL